MHMYMYTYKFCFKAVATSSHLCSQDELVATNGISAQLGKKRGLAKKK